MLDLVEAMLKSLKQFQTFIRMELRHERIVEHSVQWILQARNGMKSWIVFFDLLRLYPINLFLAEQEHLLESAYR